VFPVKSIGKTIATKDQGLKTARDSLLGRVFEASLGDLKKDAEDEAFRKFRLRVEDVQGANCLTSFNGMDITTDKLRSLVRKWQTLIEAYLDVRTTDGYALRLFAIAFTKRRPNQTRKTSYAQMGQVRNIRKKMVEIMQREASSCDLNELVLKLQNEAIGREIEKHAAAIYPLQNVYVRKVKVLRAPKADIGKMMEAHGGAEALKAAVPQAVAAIVEAPKADVGQKVDAKPEAVAEKKEEKPAPAAAKDAKAPAKKGK